MAGYIGVQGGRWRKLNWGVKILDWQDISTVCKGEEERTTNIFYMHR